MAARLSRADAYAAKRWQAFEQHARKFARGTQKRFGGCIPDHDLADLARDAVLEAMQKHPGDDDELKLEIERRIGTTVRRRKREISRTRAERVSDAAEPEAWLDGSPKGGARLASGKQKRLRCLISDSADAWAAAWTAEPGKWALAAANAEALRMEAHDLCRALEWDANAIEDAIQSGGLWRHPEYERGIYSLLVANITAHARITVQESPIIDALVKWRSVHVEVRCELCAPGSRWCLCAHTIPRFDDRGKQIAGVDLRTRGARKLRPNLRFKFGSAEVVDDRSLPPANYNDTYLQRDAAGAIVSEALRQCGIDSSVRHVMAEERRLALRDQIESFLKDWQRGPDGALTECKPKLVAPGAQRKRKRATAADGPERA